jgi:hypothetical protein
MVAEVPDAAAKNLFQRECKLRDVSSVVDV